MKKIKYILFLAGLVATTMVVSCESDEEKYSGTPVGNQDIETITGTLNIDPSITTVLTNQKVPFTVTLPFTFSDTVTVEVSSLNKSGGRTRVSVDIMPNTLESELEEIPAAGGAIFESTLDMYLSAIVLKHAQPGKHYLIKSNIITLNTGNTAVPVDDDKRFQLRFVWFNPSPSRNNFRVFVDRPNTASYVSGPGVSNVSTLVTVSSTVGLQPGMGVQVSSGQGLFPTNTVVTAVNSATTFTVSQAPTTANALGSNTVISAGGNEIILTNATSATTTNPAITTITLGSGNTNGLEVGMTVTVIDNTTGRFRPGTTISRINGPNSFNVSLAINPTLGQGVALSNATIAVSSPDVIPVVNNSVSHDIKNDAGEISNASSTAQGEYIFKMIPLNLLNSGADVPYRVVWKYPNGTTGFTEGVFEAATLNSPSKEVIKVTKSGTGTSATYTVTPL